MTEIHYTHCYKINCSKRLKCAFSFYRNKEMNEKNYFKPELQLKTDSGHYTIYICCPDYIENKNYKS